MGLRRLQPLAPALPLNSMGVIYAKVAAAPDVSSANDQLVSQRTQDLARIYHAMTRYPEMVGGEGQFCTILMEAFEGALIGKLGADGCYGIGIRASTETKALGADGAVGIAVKIDDGNIEILYAVVSEILQQLKIGAPKTEGSFRRFSPPEEKEHHERCHWRRDVGIQSSACSLNKLEVRSRVSCL